MGGRGWRRNSQRKVYRFLPLSSLVSSSSKFGLKFVVVVKTFLLNRFKGKPTSRTYDVFITFLLSTEKTKRQNKK